MAATRKTPFVPRELALLYGFANTLDMRRFVEDGTPHVAADDLANATALEAWMRDRGLLEGAAKLSRNDHAEAVELRAALREFVRHAPADRPVGADAARLNAATANFPLVVEINKGEGVRLQPQRRGALSGLGRVLAEFHHAAEIGELNRLKMCASEECQRVFYDRSKPATRRWCSSALCGNREKTRAYRARQRASEPTRAGRARAK